MHETGEIDTYSELFTRCIRTALKLKKMGIKPGDIVGVCSHNHINNCVPNIAAQMIGAITTNYDFYYTHTAFSRLLQLTQPKILFLSSNAAPNIKKALLDTNFKTKLIIFESDIDFSEFLQPDDEENTFQPYRVTNNKDTAIILYSSGTTGPPKGICIHHFGILSGLIDGNLFLSSHVKGQQPVYLMYTNLFWIGGTMSLLASMYYAGLKVHCLTYDAQKHWDIIEKYKVSSKVRLIKSCQIIVSK